MTTADLRAHIVPGVSVRLQLIEGRTYSLGGTQLEVPAGASVLVSSLGLGADTKRLASSVKGMASTSLAEASKSLAASRQALKKMQRAVPSFIRKRSGETSATSISVSVVSTAEPTLAGDGAEISTSDAVIESGALDLLAWGQHSMAESVAQRQAVAEIPREMVRVTPMTAPVSAPAPAGGSDAAQASRRRKAKPVTLQAVRVDLHEHACTECD